MKPASMSALSAALMLALATAACANEDQAATDPLAAKPTSSTAAGNTAQQTTEGATAQSFESQTALNAQSQAGTTATAPPPAGSTSTETTSATTLAGAAPTFESLDTDRDGFLARTELPAGHDLAADWAVYDTDSDERLAREDFDRYAATLTVSGQPKFADLDTNRDGFIARDEVPTNHALIGAWATYDADNDQRIARSDFDRWVLATHPDFATLDTNRDGLLTKAELPSTHALYTGFGTFDTDGDTKLSRSEFDAYGSGSAPVAQTEPSDDTDTGGETEDQPE
jgi:Ca2+-binding EF-hand superfamily protein